MFWEWEKTQNSCPRFPTTQKYQKFCCLGCWDSHALCWLLWSYLFCWCIFSLVMLYTAIRWEAWECNFFIYLKFFQTILMYFTTLCSFQLLNVYRTRYDTGGLYWPIAHNTVIFSLVLTQVICLGVFGLKESPVAAGFTIPLIILTLLFNQYCRNRLLPLFRTFPAQVILMFLNSMWRCIWVD